MTAPRTADSFWDRVRALFHDAVDATPEKRAELLDTCGDPALRIEVERLLGQLDSSGGFLERSLWELVDEADARWDRVRIGPYRVARQLGSGGMGTVVLAMREGEFDQRVAIKLVRRTAGGDAILQRFKQERQILAALEHPNIARLIDGGTTTSGVPYLVMEYVEGTPIDVYARERQLSLEARLRLFLQVCDAVQYAHRNLVIHRDIKPANVLVTPAGVAKLLDFGIAKLTSSSKGNSAPTRLMTLEYASPEQLAGTVVTTATDVYSLGVLLFELLAGAHPFGSAVRAPDTEPPRASAKSGIRALRGDLDRILLVALDPDPQRRYPSVEKFADDIRRHLGGHPIAVRRASFGYRSSKFVRRNKLFVGAAAVAVIVAAIAFAAVVQQKRIAERRFRQVRSLAHAVVFDLHDAIAKLPGSTAARALLVRQALGYLDALALESASNSQLQLELAAAYERVGDVQGMPYTANLGDTAGALASYRKALSSLERVRAEEPQSVAARQLVADVHDRIGFAEQRALRFREALRHHESALAIRETLPRDELALARTWVAIGDCRYQARGGPIPGVRQAYEQSLSALARVPRTNANAKDVLTAAGRVHQHLGSYFTGDMEPNVPLALQHHLAAEEALAARAALDPNDAVARRNYADQLVMIATLRNSVHDAEGALAVTGRALPILQALAAADPNNVEAQHDLGFVYAQRAEAQMALGSVDDASDSVWAAIAINNRIVALAPNSFEFRRDRYGLYGLVAKIARAHGDRAMETKYSAMAVSELRLAKGK